MFNNLYKNGSPYKSDKLHSAFVEGMGYTSVFFVEANGTTDFFEGYTFHGGVSNENNGGGEQGSEFGGHFLQS
jgi:hypothetical protein